MRLMISSVSPTVEAFAGRPDMRPHLGLMNTPQVGAPINRMLSLGLPWCIDNAAFNAARFNADAFLALCRKASKAATLPVFVAVPDRVGDYEATLRLFDAWLPILRRFGLPLAFVAQDGLTDPGVQIPWAEVAAVFVGGTDAYKDSMTRTLAAACQARGKWCHVGRVNGRRRLRLAIQSGADSVDGSSMTKFPRTWIPPMVDYCRQLATESEWLEGQSKADRPLVADELVRRDGIVPPVLWRAPSINPYNITNYSRTEAELDDFLVFTVAVAGKDSSRMAEAVRQLWNSLVAFSGPADRFLELLARFGRERIAAALSNAGIKPHNQKAEALHGLASAWRAGTFDPRFCSLAQLEGFRFVGPKTARFFLMHSRPGLRFACLDTHILRFLRDRGEKAPAVTPGKHSAAYRRLEARFLQMADEAGQAPTDYDLSIWRAYSGTVA